MKIFNELKKASRVDLVEAKDAFGNPLLDREGNKCFVWKIGVRRKKGYWQNGWEATSQVLAAWLTNAHANLTTSAMAGAWQTMKIKFFGTYIPSLINVFMWIFTLNFFKGRPIDKKHCLDAWKDKV